MTTIERILAAIEARVRPTICLTYSGRDGYTVGTVEGRISEDDFNTLLHLCRQRYATEARPVTPEEVDDILERFKFWRAR